MASKNISFIHFSTYLYFKEISVWENYLTNGNNNWNDRCSMQLTLNLLKKRDKGNNFFAASDAMNMNTSTLLYKKNSEPDRAAKNSIKISQPVKCSSHLSNKGLKTIHKSWHARRRTG
jgi:hypothetical protein